MSEILDIYGMNELVEHIFVYLNIYNTYEILCNFKWKMKGNL